MDLYDTWLAEGKIQKPSVYTKLTELDKGKTSNPFDWNKALGSLGAGLGIASSALDNIYSIDSSNLENQINAAKNISFNAVDNATLMEEINSWKPLDTNYGVKDVGFNWGNQLGNIGAATIAGLGLGKKHALGGALKALGAIAGIGSTIYSYIDAKNQANLMEKEAEKTNLHNQIKARYAINDAESIADNLMKQNAFASGGGMSPNNLGISFINEGGTHEQNPFGGVPMGVDPNGNQNLVEEGEIIYDDYVFSNRLEVPQELKDKYNIKDKSITFAEAVKRLMKPYMDNLEDNINKNGIEALMKEFIEVQEQVRTETQAIESNIKAPGGSLRYMKPLERGARNIVDLQTIPEGHTIANYLNLYYPGGVNQFLTDAQSSGLNDVPLKSLKTQIVDTKLRDYLNTYFSPNEPVSDLGNAGKLYNIDANISDLAYKLNIGSIKPEDLTSEDIKALLDLSAQLGHTTKEVSEAANKIAEASMSSVIEEISTVGDLKGAAKFLNTYLTPYVDLWTDEEIAQNQKASATAEMVKETIRNAEKINNLIQEHPIDNGLDLSASLVSKEGKPLIAKTNYSNERFFNFTEEDIKESDQQQEAEEGISVKDEQGISSNIANTIHNTKRGDTLAKIANIYGVSVQDILGANSNITNPNLIRVGQKIVIPSNDIKKTPPPKVEGPIKVIKQDPVIEEQEYSFDDEEDIVVDEVEFINPKNNQNLLKYAPSLINAAALTSNIIKKPDYSYAERLENSLTAPRHIKPQLLTGKLQYTPEDINYLVNKGIATGAATRNTLLNSGISAGAARANILAQNYADIENINKIYSEGLARNLSKKMNYAQYNLGIDQANAQAINRANEFNAQIDDAYRNAYMDMLKTGVGLRMQEDEARATAIGSGLTSFGNSLYNIYRDDITDAQAKFTLSYMPRLNEEGRELLAKQFGTDQNDYVTSGAKGGKINRKKKRKGLTY